MSAEFYSKDVTRFSREVMEGIRAIDDRTHGLSLLGGWAVHALVEPAYAMESQDIDIVIHNAAAWADLEPWLTSKKYGWRYIEKGERRRERDNAFIHEYHKDMRVDFFFGKHIPDEIPQKLFNTRWIATIKNFPYEGFVPSTPTILFDKLETLPKREEDGKALKDALDAGNLLFHNRLGISPKTLMAPTVRGVARTARDRITKLRDTYAARYATELTDILDLFDR